MNDSEIKTCIEINLEKVISNLKTLDEDRIHYAINTAAEKNLGLKYCLQVVDASQIRYIIHKKVKSQSSAHVVKEIEFNYHKNVSNYAERYKQKVESVIELKELCVSLGIKEEVPQYEVYHNRQICEFVDTLSKQGYRAQWKSCDAGILKLYLFPNA